MRHHRSALNLLIFSSLFLQADEQLLTVEIDGSPLIHYQASPLLNPNGGEKFKGSNFIHPLKTPSGFTVTASNPESHHHHHFGLWWPWKFIGVENNRQVLCWELQEGDGLIEARESTPHKNGFQAKSIYIDRKAPGGPRTILNETVNATTSGLLSRPVSGYWLELEIINEVAGEEPLEIQKNLYSGFTLRGTDQWAGYKATVLSSEGKIDEGDKWGGNQGQFISDINLTRARWVRVEGPAPEGTAGVLLMSSPTNHNHPEKLRTWGNREIFINFNPVQKESWALEPGQQYIRNYRVFVYDGSLTAKQAEALWQDFKTKQAQG